jgi:N-formylglutamate amidohydrolase
MHGSIADMLFAHNLRGRGEVIDGASRCDITLTNTAGFHCASPLRFRSADTC